MSTDSKVEKNLLLSTNKDDCSNHSISENIVTDFSNLYSTVNKQKTNEEEEEEEDDESIIVHVEQHQLPLGWIRCCDDENSIYYWHKPTGTVQRVPPVLTQSQQSIRDFSSSIESSNRSSVSPTIPTTSASCNNSPNHQINDNVYLNMSYHEDCKSSLVGDSINENFIKETVEGSSASSSHCSSSNDLIKFNRRFYVRTLGWVKINEQDLTAEKSSKAVNKCIHDLSHGFKDYNDVVARWGEGKDLFMDIEDDYLVLVDPIENKVLNKQAITSIRVWGVGRDNGRCGDFAYVARDKLTKVHQCHVFRCEDVPAKDIANTLRDVCKQIMVRKGLIQKSPKQLRPNLLNEIKRQENAESSSEAANFLPLIKFPTPVDEPKKTINCRYVGSIIVKRPSGVDILNDAIDSLYLNSYKSAFANIENDFDNSSLEQEEIFEEVLSNKDKTIDTVKSKWLNVAVTISPSTIYTHKINHDSTSELIFECRIRYLSFLGIASNVKLFGFFEHCADTTFKCHAYYNEPSSAPLCKTIEAACKLRFQKCLDAHPQEANSVNSNTQATNNSNKGLGTQLKNMFDLLRSRKNR